MLNTGFKTLSRVVKFAIEESNERRSQYKTSSIMRLARALCMQVAFMRRDQW